MLFLKSTEFMSYCKSITKNLRGREILLASFLFYHLLFKLHVVKNEYFSNNNYDCMAYKPYSIVVEKCTTVYMLKHICKFEMTPI